MADFTAGKYRLPLGARAYVMGILNVTPDSFSDGGRFFTADAALRHALEMQEQGADLIDIGAQSTRPGHTKITPEEEWARLEPVLTQLKGKLHVPLSVDTFYPRVAVLALENGADLINDVTGFDDPEMVAVAAKSDCGCIAMHHIGSDGKNILDAVHSWFLGKLRQLTAAGIAPGRICLDPGVGFGKTQEENLCILANTARLRVADCAFLMAASRKRVIGGACGNPPFEQRMPGTVAAHSISIYDGADIVRAHDVPEAVQSAQLASAIRRYRIG